MDQARRRVSSLQDSLKSAAKPQDAPLRRVTRSMTQDQAKKGAAQLFAEALPNLKEVQTKREKLAKELKQEEEATSSRMNQTLAVMQSATRDVRRQEISTAASLANFNKQMTAMRTPTPEKPRSVRAAPQSTRSDASDRAPTPRQQRFMDVSKQMGNAITRLDNANAVAFSPIKLQQGMSQVRQHLKRAMTAGDMEVVREQLHELQGRLSQQMGGDHRAVPPSPRTTIKIQHIQDKINHIKPSFDQKRALKVNSTGEGLQLSSAKGKVSELLQMLGDEAPLSHRMAPSPLAYRQVPVVA